mgnify:FL=1
MMLTQHQVNRICRMLGRSKRRLAKEPTRVFEEISAEVGCGVSTVSNIYRGKRNRLGKVPRKSRNASLCRETIMCPNCGRVRGEVCVRCHAVTNRTCTEVDQIIEAGPEPNDPSPELIALRAAKIRRDRERARRKIDYTDPEIALWVARPFEALHVKQAAIDRARTHSIQ